MRQPITKSTTYSNEPRLGSGIFLPKDVAQILNLPYSRVRHWIFEFWDNRFGQDWAYSFGTKGNKAVDFYTLIEFYVFYQLRIKGVSAQQVQKVHVALSRELDTKYPFAHAKISTDGRDVWYEQLDNLIRVDGKRQYDIKYLLDPFLKRIDFGKDNIAERYYPLQASRNIVVDPKHQFGQPVIAGTNIKVQTLANLHNGGETLEDIADLYNLPLRKVADAIKFLNAA